MSGTTYCYCKKPACNTPEKKLADPPVAARTEEDEGINYDPVLEEMEAEGSGWFGSDDDDDDEGG